MDDIDPATLVNAALRFAQMKMVVAQVRRCAGALWQRAGAVRDMTEAKVFDSTVG
ncbi:hypothetical protein J2X06_002215 [Lysobacter niastensis]|uniref:Uncharacterized protein n=1 Tax=Lysobacter niastensis TaxID=380629 RepID=A0ABU1WBP3_9GAMM|nr:hypothetical protein [Lysobacter niastensis]MDR7135006.1 hypothetical protein [Lysobacter niastensis]